MLTTVESALVTIEHVLVVMVFQIVELSLMAAQDPLTFAF